MSRKPNVATTSNDEEKILDVVENTENKELNDGKADKSADKSEKKEKEIKDDDDVKIKNDGLKNRSVYTTNVKNPIIFDENGVAVVKGIEAKRLLQIPGYVRA